MTRTNRNGKGEGNQPLLFPIGDMGPPDDPVGDALGLGADDGDAAWAEVMDLFGRLSVRAYRNAQAKSSASDVIAS